MKSEVDIREDVYKVIKGSALEAAVTGKLCKSGKRPKYEHSESPKEDITINVLSSNIAQTQEAIVNVNIYVKSVDRKGVQEVNDPRLRVLCQKAIEVLEVAHDEGFRIHLDKQRVFETEEPVGEHIINNRIIYNQTND